MVMLLSTMSSASSRSCSEESSRKLSFPERRNQIERNLSIASGARSARVALGHISAEKSGPDSSKIRLSMSGVMGTNSSPPRIQYVPLYWTGMPMGRDGTSKISTRPCWWAISSTNIRRWSRSKSPALVRSRFSKAAVPTTCRGSLSLTPSTMWPPPSLARAVQ